MFSLSWPPIPGPAVASSPLTTVTVTFEPFLVALTSTPSIAASSGELISPVKAAGACAKT